MKSVNLKILWSTCVVGFFLASQSFAYTKWEDVKSWQRYGTRWVAGYDDSGKMLAVYDISYPTLWDSVVLGEVGSKKVTWKTIANLMRGGSGPLNDHTQEELDSAVRQLNALPEEASQMPSKWWNKIPWKKKGLSKSPTAPSQFFLADIDFKLLQSKTATTAQGEPLSVQDQFNALDLRNEYEDDATFFLTKNFLKQFEYVRNADGSYTLLFHPAQESGIFGFAKNVSHPYKMVDLQTPQLGLWRSLRWEVIQKGLSLAIGAIPNPIIAALVETPISRLFDFRKQMFRRHLEAMLEMVNSANRNDPQRSPFAPWTGNDQQLAGEGLHYAKANLFDALYFVVKPAETQWKERMEKDQRYADEATQWLTEHHETLGASLNPYFVKGTDTAGVERLYALSNYHVKSARPHAAIDYAHPERQKTERILIEIATTLVSFGSGFIPMNGGVLLDALYEFFVVDPSDHQREWEARLTVDLEERMLKGEDWSKELAILDDQRVNPLQMSRGKMQELMRLRLEKLGLH